MAAISTCKGCHLRRLLGRVVVSMEDRVQAVVQVCLWVIKLLSLQMRVHGSYFVIEKSYKYLAFCRCDETESSIPSMWICLSSPL